MSPLDPIATRVARGFTRVASRVTPSPKTESAVRFPEGYALKLPPHLPSARKLQAGLYEPEVTDLFRSLLRPGMTLLDVGANVGYYTLLGAQLVGPTGRVIAFEPEADAYRYLTANISNSAFTNVLAINKAVADTDGEREFRRNALEKGFLTHGDSPRAQGDGGPAPLTAVDTVSLDSFLATQGWPAVHLVKVDAEGSEGLVLDGMKATSSRNTGLRLIMEFNLNALRRAGTTPLEIRDHLIGLGFRTAYVIEQSLRPIDISDSLPASGLIYNLLLAK